jgi:di/tricarboxylate transporter
MSRLALIAALIALVVCVLPDAAGACSVCYGGAEESRKAFLFTTVLLSLLPIGMLGGLGWWVWSINRDTEASEPPAPSAPVS